MKHVTSIFDVLIVMIIMMAGVTGIALLSKSLTEDLRFEDKSVWHTTNSVEYEYDPELGEYTAPTLWNSNLRVEDIIAMSYIQDGLCPETEYGTMQLHMGNSDYSIDDTWGAQKSSYFIRVYNDYYADLNADKNYRLSWDKHNNKWVVVEVN